MNIKKIIKTNSYDIFISIINKNLLKHDEINNKMLIRCNKCLEKSIKIENKINSQKNKTDDESYFLFYKDITKYHYFTYNNKLNWKLIISIFSKYIEDYVNKSYDFNEIIKPNFYSKKFISKNYSLKYILTDIINIIYCINNYFFSFITIINGELVNTSSLQPFYSYIPIYFYKNPIYIGSINLKINGKKYNFNSPTLDEIKKYIIGVEYSFIDSDR